MGETQKLKNARGITLVALVVTIIVLIILAGVSINMVLGQNGIITQAKEAKEKTLNAEVHDQEKINEVVEYIRNNRINEEDKDEENKENSISVEEVTNKPETYYGAIVKGYECTNSAGVTNWKIFYADEDNIYLIADNYIHKDYCPNSKTQEITVNDTAYKISMDNVVKDYTGSIDITDATMQKLNKKYFEYLKTNGNETSTNDNIKAVAYMTDTNVWSGFTGNKAEYAIGGPTLEMLFDSYNQKYKLNNKYQTKVEGTMGYKISTDKGITWKYYTESDYLEKDDSLYVIGDQTNANAMWVCSPSTYSDTRVFSVSYSGTVNYGDYRHYTIGFRPIVCLKSDVELEKQENDIYIIK